MRIISDIFAYTSQNMPKFNSISISGYHMQEAGATADLEMAYTLADGLEYAADRDRRRHRHRRKFAPRLSFFWAIGMNYFMEVAKMRAARLLWAKLSSSSTRRTRSRCPAHALADLGWSLTEQDPFNNVTRTCIEAMAAALGHTQSLHTNALDEAIALPTDFSARIARNTQLFLQEERRASASHRPVGRQLLCRALTHDLAANAPGPTLRRSRDRRNGQGHRGRSSEDAHRGGRGTHARRASTADAAGVVGVNKYRWTKEDPLDVLKVDNAAVRASRSQLAKLAPEARARRTHSPQRWSV
jgi:methylmalonyl-CoA mutase